MLMWSFYISPGKYGIEHGGPQDHLLSDLDGSCIQLIMDHRALGYFEPWWCMLSGYAAGTSHLYRTQ